MDILVNEKVINSLFNGKNFNAQLKAMLNEMIDEELAKEPDNMDCDLIEECVQMLIDIEQESDKGFAVIVPLLKSSKIISACEKSGFKHLSRGIRASLIACIVLFSAITANAAVDKIFDYNIAQEVASTISEKLKDWGIIANAEDNDEIVIDKIPLNIKPKEEKEKPEETTCEPVTEPTSKAVTKHTVINSGNIENMDGGMDDDEEPTTQPTTQAGGNIENVDGGMDDDEPTTEPSTENSENAVAQKYTLTLDADGGECELSSIEVEYGKPIGELPVPTREGYEFGGWYNIDISYTRTNGKKSETALKSSTIYNLEKDATVKAKWYKYYSIVLNANGGQCDIDIINISLLTSIDEINLPTPTREGYVFLCWLDMNGDPVTDMQYLWLSTLFSDPYYELTACWIEDGITLPVTFNANGGQCDVQSKDVMIGHPYGKLPVPVRSGWNFLGWFVANDLGYDLVIEQITEDTIFTFPYYTELYALWYKTTATVTFDANGGECDIQSKTVYSHNSYGDLPTPTKEGYIFVGWYYNERLISSYSDVGEKPTDHTLTAKWVPVNVSVTFNANGGKMSSNNDISITQKYSYMTEYGSFPEATRTGYKLVGWFTEREGGTKVEKTDIVDYLGGKALYAHWEKDENICAVTLYSNSDNVSVLTYNKGDKLGNVKPTVDGGLFYEFIGWYNDKYYGEMVDSDFEITGDTELYAHWCFDKSIVKNTLKLDKTEYELGEEIDLRSIEIIVNVGNISSETFTGDMLADEGAILDYDTSTYGKHTLTVTLTMDAGYMLTFEASETIFVKGCEHGVGTHMGNQLEPTCNKDGYTGDALCNGCNEILETGTAIKALGHNANTVTKIINQKDATCTQTGYTGDTACAECNTILKSGKSISKINHITEEVITKATFVANGKIAKVCKMCGTTTTSTKIYSATATLDYKTFTYDGRMKTPSVTVKPISNREKPEYTVTMDEGRTEIGEYNVYVTLTGDYYEGEKVLTFNITPSNAKELRLTAVGGGTLVIEWDKVEDIDGYEIQYYKPSSTGYTIISLDADSTSLTVDNLDQNDVYYVHIRTCKNGIYSPWSSHARITIK